MDYSQKLSKRGDPEEIFNLGWADAHGYNGEVNLPLANERDRDSAKFGTRKWNE
jgi:hypothetical protein